MLARRLDPLRPLDDEVVAQFAQGATLLEFVQGAGAPFGQEWEEA